LSFDRGLGRAVLLRTQYEMRTDESIEAVGILRLPDGDNAWRLTYSRKLSHHWQMEVRGGIFAGDRHEFLGQFRDSGNMAARRQMTRYLAEHRDGRPILASMASLAHYMQETSAAGFNLAAFVHEGNGAFWQAALADPARHVGWMLIEECDCFSWSPFQQG
jgi:hypothetical protein